MSKVPEEIQNLRKGNMPDWSQINSSDMDKAVGRCMLRTAPHKLNGDRSFMSEGVILMNVSPYNHMSFKGWLTTNYLLSPDWNDGRWAIAPDSCCDQVFDWMIKQSEN